VSEEEEPNEPGAKEELFEDVLAPGIFMPRDGWFPTPALPCLDVECDDEGVDVVVVEAELIANRLGLVLEEDSLNWLT